LGVLSLGDEAEYDRPEGKMKKEIFFQLWRVYRLRQAGNLSMVLNLEIRRSCGMPLAATD
jgi:hypothetical protein